MLSSFAIFQTCYCSFILFPCFKDVLFVFNGLYVQEWYISNIMQVFQLLLINNILNEDGRTDLSYIYSKYL